MNAQPAESVQPLVVPIRSAGSCERVEIRTADGRTFDLGRPDSIFFKLRVRLYRWRRRHEFTSQT